MSSKTTNFNLHKIDLTDAPPDITVLNGNFDIIDTQLKLAKESVSKHASTHAPGGSDPITPASIGAIKKSGDTMTGTLDVPMLTITDNILKGYVIAEGSSPKLQIISQEKSTGRDGMLIVSPGGLFFLGIDDGYEREVVHAGNLNKFSGVLAASLE